MNARSGSFCCGIQGISRARTRVSMSSEFSGEIVCGSAMSLLLAASSRYRVEVGFDCCLHARLLTLLVNCFALFGRGILHQLIDVFGFLDSGCLRFQDLHIRVVVGAAERRSSDNQQASR